MQQQNSSLSSKPVGSVFAVGTSFPVGVESAGSTVTKDELASVRNQRGRKVAGGGCKHGGQPGGGLHADRLLRTPLPLSPGPRTEPWSWGHICGVSSNTVPPRRDKGDCWAAAPRNVANGAPGCACPHGHPAAPTDTVWPLRPSPLGSPTPSACREEAPESAKPRGQRVALRKSPTPVQVCRAQPRRGEGFFSPSRSYLEI